MIFSKTCLVLGFICVIALAPDAMAGARRGAAIGIGHAWSAPTPPSAPTAAGYLTITNRGHKPDRLLSLSSPAAAAVDLHLMSMEGESSGCDRWRRPRRSGGRRCTA